MTCPLCKGKMLKGFTNLPFGIGENLLVVKDVPAFVCEQCGDSFVEIENVRIVEKLVISAEKDGVTLGFIKFRNAA